MKLRMIFALTIWIGTMTAQSIWDQDPLEIRNTINQKIMAIEGEKTPVMSIDDLVIDNSTPIRIYRPSEHVDLPAILFIHGGAWIGGNLDTHDNLARYLCAKTGSLVVSVGYLNSPEGKFPFPLMQCYLALEWTIQNETPSSLTVVGDSAGGNMAAALCMMARDRKRPKIDRQVLINPATDLSHGVEQQNDPFDSIRYFTKHYVPNSCDLTNYYLSPLHAKDLNHLPPALVILAENDLLKEMGQRYADRLAEAGIPTTVYIQQGVDHLAGHGARVATLAKESLDEAVTWIRSQN